MGFARQQLQAVEEGRSGRPEPQTGCISAYLLDREGGFGRLSWQDRLALASKPILSLREREFKQAYNDIDKAFCMAWLDHRSVLVGTKCNTLFKLDVVSGKRANVMLPAVPPTPPGVPPVVRNWMGHCGMHAIALNPGGTYVVTGGKATEDIVVLRRDTLSPVQTFQGHLDWVFGLAWMTDQHVVSASRDQTIRLWQVYDDGTYQTTAGVASKTVAGHKNKVRDLRFNRERRQLLSLCVDGSLKLWDAALDPVHEYTLPNTNELVCTATCGDMAAVGSKGHVDLIDLRMGKVMAGIGREYNRSSGIRSLQFKTEHLLSYGTGSGSLVFLDLRMAGSAEAACQWGQLAAWHQPAAPAAAAPASGAQPQQPQQQQPVPSSSAEQRDQRAAARAARRAALAVEPPPDVQHYPKAAEYSLSEGHITIDETYRAYFQNLEVSSACYAHAWDASGTRCMAVGGPLMYGLRGIYLALWD